MENLPDLSRIKEKENDMNMQWRMKNIRCIFAFYGKEEYDVICFFMNGT